MKKININFTSQELQEMQRAIDIGKWHVFTWTFVDEDDDEQETILVDITVNDILIEE